VKDERGDETEYLARAGRGRRGANEEETGERVSPAPPRDDAAGGRGVGREETLEKG